MRRPLALLALLAAGCGGAATSTVTIRDAPRTVTVTTSVGSTVAVPSAGPLAPGGFAPIAKGLRQVVGYDPLVLDVGLYRDYAIFRVLDKRIAGNVDQYTWRDGVFDPPDPVKVSNPDTLADDAFALEVIRPDAPSRIVRYLSTVKLEGAGDDTPYVSTSWDWIPTAEKRELRLRSSVNGTRHDVYLTFDLAGNLLKREDR
jgi:hypothetical protein